jgi:hypothetical protein
MWGPETVMESPPRVELFVRSLAPTDARETQEQVVNRLQSLDENDRIRGVDYTLCGECVCPSLNSAETDIAQLLLGRYERFETWAESNGRDLIGFERRETEPLLTGTSVTGIVFPRLTLAEFRGGDVSFVAPSTDGTEQTTVKERLDAY